MKLEVITRRPTSEPRNRPLLFVHGAWHGAWCWDEHFLPYFAERGYEAHAVSLRGHGESEIDKSLRLVRIRDYVDDVASVAEGLDTPPVLIGHSMGGLVVQMYLEDHDAAGGVLLASDPVRGVLGTTLRTARRHPLPFLKANLTWNLYPIVGTPELARDAFFTDAMPDEQVAAYHRRLQAESYLGYLDMMFRLPKPDRVEAPVMVMGARKDAIFTPAEIAATAAAYGTEPVMFDDMGHDMMLEPGWEQVADSIVEWLET
jgi:pimeloyl-ACP methyl ester carboxylesterase